MADYLMAMYRLVGYDCYAVSALREEGIDVLREIMKDKTTLLAGHSGVGKSTLMNVLIPGANVKTAAISDAHGAGMHTTTFSELRDLPFGGSIIDIPGIKGFGTFNMEPEEVAHFFRDIFEISTTAASITACTSTNLVAPSSKHSKITNLPPAATPLTFLCWRIKKKGSIGRG